MSLVEFALTLPLIATLGVGGLELANLALTNMRVNQIALAVADNAGRVTVGIDEANIVEVFAGARVTGDPIDFEENGRVILSSLQHNGLPDPDTGQVINWQRCFGELEVDPLYGEEDFGRADDALQGMGPEGRQITALPNSAIMFVEVSYNYRPLIGGVLTERMLRYESAFIVRGRVNNNISNTGNIAENDCT